MTEPTLQLHIRTDTGFINLRGDPQNAIFRKAAEAVLGQPLPLAANTMSAGDSRVYWLGPDEWLIAAAADRSAHLLACLNESLSNHHAAVNDVSGGNVALRIGGAAARELFAKGCALDFHPDVFTVGSCAQSGLAKASVLIGLIDEVPTFDVIVRRSFSDYLLEWLRHAGREYGIEFH